MASKKWGIVALLVMAALSPATLAEKCPPGLPVGTIKPSFLPGSSFIQVTWQDTSVRADVYWRPVLCGLPESSARRVSSPFRILGLSANTLYEIITVLVDRCGRRSTAATLDTVRTAPRWSFVPVVFWEDSLGVQAVPQTAAIRVRFRTIESHSNVSHFFRGDSVGVLPIRMGDTVTFLVTVYDSTNNVIFEEELDIFNSFSTAVFGPGKPETARGFSLEQNYPNPFNPATTIAFSLARPSQVRLSVFDLVGHEIEVLTNGELPAGQRHVRWDATNFAAGVYFYRLKIGNFVETKKMVLTK